jgi:hypothetical protein
MRCPGSGRYDGEVSPSDVESPMWTTVRQDVWSGVEGGVVVAGVVVALAALV